MMKRFYSLSRGALLVALLAGFESIDTANVQTSDQSARTDISKKANGSNESVDLEQRTGIPFQIRQSTQETLPLLAIMLNLEQNLAVVQAGIWRGDYQAISKAADALVNHEKMPARESRKIETILGKEGLEKFVAADESWHNKAKELARQANEKNMKQIVNLTADLIQQCAGCHIKYRERLRDNPIWLER